MRTREKLTLVAISLALAVVVGGIGYRLSPRTVLPAPAVAEAEVISFEAQILAAPESGAKPLIRRLKKGDRLNVLRLPRSRDERWVEVQYAGKEGLSRPGYVQSWALGHWSSERPDAALALLKLFGPGEGATEAEVREQLLKLTAFLDRFRVTEHGPEANLELARLNLVIARRQQSQGKPLTNWQPHLALAAKQLAAASASQSLAGLVDAARRELEALQELERTGPIQKRVAAGPQPEEAIREAEEAGQEARYDEALRLLARVLRDRPNHRVARSLYDKILRAKSKDPGAR